MQLIDGFLATVPRSLARWRGLAGLQTQTEISTQTKREMKEVRERKL
jgi:hypothetical protein